MDNFSNVWLWDDSVSSYVDNTLEAVSEVGTSFEIIAQANDDLYLGYSLPFKGFVCNVSTAGSYTNLTYKYWDGASWIRVVPLREYNFSQSKYFVFTIPNNWVKRNLNDANEHAITTLPDNSSRYWIKIEATAITTAARINQILCIPQVFYTTPDKVSRFLQLKISFTDETKPTLKSILSLIQRAEDRIDYRARKSWRFNVSEKYRDNTEDIYELYDYNRYGIKLKHPDIQKIYSVKIWNGGSWDTLTEGRNNDYFVDNATGIIYITRLFLLPAMYGMTGRYFHFGFGEYKKSVQVDYSWGKDGRIDPTFYIVDDIATKMVAIGVIESSDYSILTSSGIDKIPLSEKARIWDMEIETKLDEMVGVVLY